MSYIFPSFLKKKKKKKKSRPVISAGYQQVCHLCRLMSDAIFRENLPKLKVSLWLLEEEEVPETRSVVFCFFFFVCGTGALINPPPVAWWRHRRIRCHRISFEIQCCSVSEFISNFSKKNILIWSCSFAYDPPRPLKDSFFFSLGFRDRLLPTWWFWSSSPCFI